ncbi:ankyrin repeat domain-containing protein 65-like isoform X3 [Scylla paramamosain]|uniref:ankyrin repeat domain-containing protein 65-like isoform X3 n=1 Tax=Scylla paramamosain TaxID=85552 RepID=UPI003083530C
MALENCGEESRAFLNIRISFAREGEGVSDAYEDYLALAYAKEVDSDTYPQDEDGLADGPLEEEVDRTEVFTERPVRVFTVQLLRPRTGWVTVYKGSGGSCLLQGLSPSQDVTARIQVAQDSTASPWTLVTAHTKSLPVSGQDLVEAVRENNATSVRDVLTDLMRFSQVERVDGAVEGGHTALVAGVAAGARDALAVLVERRAAVASATAGPHLTPLAMAAWEGRTDLARRLRTAGADWNLPDRNGFTALHYGVAGGRLEVVKAALQDGADVKLPAGCHPPLTLALAGLSSRAATSSRKRMEEGEEEEEEREEDKEDQVACKMVELLLDGGAEVNQRGSGGNTALHEALNLGMAPLARQLVAAGADPHLANGRGYTPTHLALLTGHSLDTATPRDQDKPAMGELEALTHLVDEETRS